MGMSGNENRTLPDPGCRQTTYPSAATTGHIHVTVLDAVCIIRDNCYDKGDRKILIEMLDQETFQFEMKTMSFTSETRFHW